MPEEDVHTTKTDQLKFQDPTTRYPSISPPKQDQPSRDSTPTWCPRPTSASSRIEHGPARRT